MEKALIEKNKTTNATAKSNNTKALNSTSNKTVSYTVQGTGETKNITLNQTAIDIKARQILSNTKIEMN